MASSTGQGKASGNTSANVLVADASHKHSLRLAGRYVQPACKQCVAGICVGLSSVSVLHYGKSPLAVCSRVYQRSALQVAVDSSRPAIYLVN